MKSLNFETKFTIVFLIIAFFDEVLTLDIGGVFFTPLKAFSIYATLLYLSKLKSGIRKNKSKDQVRSGFNLLYIYILVSLFISVIVGSENLISHLERFFHFLSSLFIIDLFVQFFYQKRIDINKVIYLLIGIYFVELFVAFSELLLNRSLINYGVVQLSPLKIRGFHGDRVFLAEYLALGWFLLYINKTKLLKLLFFGCLTFIVVVSSGSNTAMFLFGMVGIYIAYTFKNKALKVFIIALGLLASTSYGAIRNAFLSDYAIQEINKRDELYYSQEIDASSNWRLFAINQILRDFEENPTLFGHGYEASIDFLERSSNYLYNMKAHNIVSVLYDYGVIGGIFAIILLLGLFKTAFKMFILRRRTVISHLAFIFSILIISRLLFYYHTSIVWVYIFGIAIIVIGNRLAHQKSLYNR